MARAIRTAIYLVAGALFCGSACAMNTPAARSEHCQVVDGGKLPAASGGAAALCAAIERAVATHAPGTEFSARVRVLSRSRLTASVAAKGRLLPEQSFASMDRDLDNRSFERFAAAIAAQVAQSVRGK